MKKLLLLILALGFSAMVNAQKKPYNNLIITEARFNMPSYDYCEVTNMGTETIDLSEFKLCALRDVPWIVDANASFVFPKVALAPGKSYVLATTFDAQPRMWAKDVHGSLSDYSKNWHRPWVQAVGMEKLSDYLFDMPEGYGAAVKDSVTPHSNVMLQWSNSVWFLKHFYTIDGIPDSMIIDQIGGVFDSPEGTNVSIPYDVAGVKGATDLDILIRKASVTTGITEFSSHAANDEAARMQFNNSRGLDLADSQWIPVPYLGVTKHDSWMRAAFWTVGNQGDYKLDANTLVPKKSGEIIVDLAQGTITVPWGMGYNDTIMNHFVRKPGLAWTYYYAPTKQDSMYTSIRNGDKLILYVCGKEATIKTFNFVVKDPTPSDNKVLSKTLFKSADYRNYGYRRIKMYEVTDGIAGMDTIRGIDFGTRVDTLYEYLEKAPKASWKIIPKNGLNKAELFYGDILQVTSESGTLKKYFLKTMDYAPSLDAQLASVTWPDMPSFFKGDIAGLYGWKGDTIPGFTPSNTAYIVKIPLGYEGIPALVFTKEDINSTVVVNRAKTLDGTLEDATAIFTVTAQDGIAKKVYSIRFDQEKDPSLIQPFAADPYISQIQVLDRNQFPWLELANPGTEPIDLTHYMIMAGRGDVATIFNSYNLPANYNRAYSKYVPGKKWQAEADWTVQPRLLENDLVTNPVLAPGDVFVMTAMDLAKDADASPGDVHWFQEAIDFNFWKTPWGTGSEIGDILAIRSTYDGVTICLFKILNDSVRNGLKPTTDIDDFKLIDVVGNGQSSTPWLLAGNYKVNQKTGLTRKPTIYKGNPEFNGSFGTNPDNCEWTWVNIAILKTQGWTWWPTYIWHQADGMGSQVMDPVGIFKSTVTSTTYKVSPGYTQAETIKGLTTGTTVTGFYGNIMKADAQQTLKVKSAATGLDLADASVISKGDKLVVVSADTKNSSTYILDVTATGLSSNALLTSAKYTINTTGATGTISGIPQRTLLKTVFAGVVVPPNATLTITDASDAYVSLSKINYDSTYVNVIATDNIYFEVIAENGTTRILYQLVPTSNPSDAYVTSDLYSVDQFASLIQFVPGGTTTTSLLSNVTPAKGATLAIYDKTGFVRETGNVYRDDKLVVTSADGTSKKAYFLSMLNFYVNTYLAYVISDAYTINQIAHSITGPKTSTTLGEFYAKLYPSFGATLSVLDKNGNVSNLADLSLDDKLVVTAADGKTKAVYDIKVDITQVVDPNAVTIKMYPNPTTNRVIIQGLAKGNRVQVVNVAGITLRDVIVDNSTEYVSLSAQPAGIYIFMVSSADQYINIQKIVKK